MRVIEARQKVENGRLARSGRADQGHGLAGLDAQGHVLEGGCAVRIGEAHLVKGNRALRHGELRCIQGGRDRVRLVEDGKDAFQHGKAFLDHGIERADGADRGGQKGDTGEHAHQVTDRAFARHQAPAGDQDENGQSQPAHGFQDRVDAGLVLGNAEEEGEAVGKGLAGAFGLEILQPVGLHHARAGEALFQLAGHFAHLRLGLVGGLAQALADADHGPGGDRIDDQDEQGQHPVQPQHPADGGDHLENVPQEIIGQADQGLTQKRDVIGEARDQRTDRLVLQAGEVGADQFGEHGVLQVLHHRQGEPVGLDGLQVEAGRADQGQGDNRQRPDPGKGLHPAFQRVEHMADHADIGGRSPCRHRRQEHGQTDQAAMPGQAVAPQPTAQLPG